MARYAVLGEPILAFYPGQKSSYDFYGKSTSKAMCIEKLVTISIWSLL